jgi:hypothetical protein
MTIKLEHIDNLSRWKKSWNNIGSRWVPHHLYSYERLKYNRAIENKYLEITKKDRINLINLWDKVCIAKGWNNLILIKDSESWNAEILKDWFPILSGITKEMKQRIKQL